ncbi:MAG: hypothetical protein QOF49_22, partial [Chloroflexota bacterium]|nr:hypothetical protein [Chloroflexota bacterium]
SEPLGLDRETDRVVIRSRPVRLAGSSLRAEESKSESHAGEASAFDGFARSAKTLIAPDILRLAS